MDVRRVHGEHAARATPLDAGRGHGVAITLGDVARLVAAFPDDAWYVSPEAVREALLRGTSFNVIDIESGWKADFMPAKARPFSRTELERRQRADVLGTPAWVATIEDTVLSKLEWSRLAGGSARQLEDVLGLLAAQWDNLDLDYLASWAPHLGVAASLEDAIATVSARRGPRPA
jgi:hypothetical protein